MVPAGHIHADRTKQYGKWVGKWVETFLIPTSYFFISIFSSLLSNPCFFIAIAHRDGSKFPFDFQ